MLRVSASTEVSGADDDRDLVCGESAESGERPAVSAGRELQWRKRGDVGAQGRLRGPGALRAPRTAPGGGPAHLTRRPRLSGRTGGLWPGPGWEGDSIAAVVR